MILHLILQLLSSFAEDTVVTLLVIPAFVEEIKGLCVTVRRPSVRPAAISSNSSYTTDARVIKQYNNAWYPYTYICCKRI